MSELSPANTRWLIKQIDKIHAALCPNQCGTWQQRAEQSAQAAGQAGKREMGPELPELTEEEAKDLWTAYTGTGMGTDWNLYLIQAAYRTGAKEMHRRWQAWKKGDFDKLKGTHLQRK